MPPRVPRPNAQYTTITDAVNAAAPGDQIDICPALYPEQLIISKTLSLRGVAENGVDRVLLQPSPMIDLSSLPYEAVITVMNAQNVIIDNLAIDASHNAVSGCDLSLAEIHFLNSSGVIKNNAISGAHLTKQQSCSALFPGNGFGVQVESCGILEVPGTSDSGNTIHNNVVNDAYCGVG